MYQNPSRNTVLVVSLRGDRHGNAGGSANLEPGARADFAASLSHEVAAASEGLLPDGHVVRELSSTVSEVGRGRPPEHQALGPWAGMGRVRSVQSLMEQVT